jgi:xylulokinase
MAFDINLKKWSHKILTIADISSDLLSNPCPSGTLIGPIRHELKDEVGFRNIVYVVTGGHDQPCGALGAGILEGKLAMNATGTVDALCPVFRKLKYSENMLKYNYPIYPYVIKDYFCTIAFNLSGGLILKWYRDVLCTDEKRRAKKNLKSVYELILSEMSNVPKDVFILPHFVGSGTPFLDPFSKGAIVGLKASTNKNDLTRAIIDSLNYEMRFNIECFKKNNIKLTEIRAVGGGSKSNKWIELKASCFGIPVKKTKVNEAVSLGASILAGYGTKYFYTIQEGTSNMVSIVKTYYPNKELMKLYDEKYEKYKKIYHLLKDYNKELI